MIDTVCLTVLGKRHCLGDSARRLFGGSVPGSIVEKCIDCSCGRFAVTGQVADSGELEHDALQGVSVTGVPAIRAGGSQLRGDPRAAVGAVMQSSARSRRLVVRSRACDFREAAASCPERDRNREPCFDEGSRVVSPAHSTRPVGAADPGPCPRGRHDGARRVHRQAACVGAEGALGVAVALHRPVPSTR